MNSCPEAEPRARGLEGAESSLLHDFFERAALRWPERVAVNIPPGNARPERKLVTYAELDTESNALAQRLRPLINGECVIGILLSRATAQLFIAQLAVLKAGAAYTCLDPSFPDERIQEILEDAGAVALLTDSSGRARARRCGLDSLQQIDLGVACATSFLLEVGADETESASWQTPQSLAYVIYTSGTTGRPKGVMIEHHSIVNLVASDIETFRLSPGDRIVQGSSAAYDSSVEETWLAFAVGATLVVMDEDAARLGPDLIAWLRRERITVFCPPPTLLRASGCDNPEVALPDLKLLYVGGEALPRDVADRWSRGRELVNGYGPTECTVTCLRGRVEAGQLVTIGRPVRGMKAWVLNVALEEVAPGERGELCVGGVGLARGYWKRPELTAEKFITHPVLGRLYRTGDLVHCDPAGQFFYHGRIDAQVKLRGYRIELGEIESRLEECPGVRAAACRVQEDGRQAALVAFIVPDDVLTPPSAENLKSALGTVLPAYMVPARYGFLSELPTTVGGKLNRAALPRLAGVARPTTKETVLPRGPMESRLAAAFQDILRVPGPVSIHEDFFNDLGGDSLSAAQLVTLLRGDPATAWIAVRDIYEARTVALLAGQAPANANSADPLPAASAEENATREAAGRPWVAGMLQTAWLAKGLVIGSAAAYVAAFHILPAATSELGVVPLLLLAPPLFLAGLALYVPLSVRYAVWVKTFLIGRYQPLRAPVWGGFYMRNWIVQKTVRLVPWGLIEGTEFQMDALRALGARIGQRVHLHRGVDLLRGGWDLLEIGDDVSVGQDVALGLVEYEAGQILIGKVSLGNGCTLDTHSSVGGDASVGANAFLAARSTLPRGGSIPPGERWDGIAARPAGTAPEPPQLPANEHVLSPRMAGLWLMLARMILATALVLPFELFAIGAALIFGLDGDTATALDWLVTPTINAALLLGVVAAAVLPMPLMLLAEALACRMMGCIRPGVMSRWSPGYIRVWLKSGLMDSGSRWLYGTLFWPVWLRLAGMKVGKGCEISSLVDTIPELVEIGDQTFCADGIYLGGARLLRGTVTLAATRLGRNNFIGNGAIIPGGTRLPDDVLLGVCTVANESQILPGTSWFGHPAFELPRREVIELDPRLTHHPTVVRYLVRMFWELLRFTLPAAFALIIPVWYAGLTMAEAALPFALLLLAAIPLLNFLVVTAPAVLVLAIKWTLLGRVRPGIHPLWSSWASRWDFVCLAWNIYAAETVSMLDGTPWLAWLLRASGVRVGRGVVLAHGFAVDLPDPDMLTLEDGATMDCLFQAHTFEDRVLKMHYVTVRRDATVGRNAVLLYGAEIGAAAQVASNSVVMKHEHLLAGLRYEGAPTRPLGEVMGPTFRGSGAGSLGFTCGVHRGPEQALEGRVTS